MSTALIQIVHASVGYKDKKIVDQIDLTIHRSEVVGLIGANGSGKSTLIRTICGQLSLMEGQILANGVDLHKLDPTERAKHLAAVLTGGNLSMGLDVETVVKMGRYPYLGWAGRLSSKRDDFVHDCMRFCGIEHLSERRLYTLSDGENQRVQIARAMAQDTAFIAFDEPTAFLDVRGRTQFFEMIGRFRDESQKSILFSAHDLHDVVRVCDRIIVIYEGKLIELSPEEREVDQIIQRYF